MNRRALLVGLAVCTALVLAGLWQLSTPKERARVVKPAEGDIFADGETAEDTPLAASLDEPQLDGSTPTPRKLAPPPEAPTVENDPAKGRVWLRLLDARNNQPLRDTNCSVIRGLKNEYLWQISYEDGRRRTDKDGLVDLSVGVVESVDDTGYGERAWDVCFYIDTVDWFTLPVPIDWFPTESSYSFADELEALISTPSPAPIDVLVAPAATLRIVARDEWGQPVPDARLEPYWINLGQAGDDWMPQRDDMAHSWGSAWDEWTDSLAAIHRRASVTAIFNGKQAESGDSSGPDSREVYDQPRTGAITLRGLPCVRAGAFAYRTGLGFGESTIDLQPGHNELNVYLRAPATCTLSVRIEWLGGPLDEDETPQLSLSSSGPYGVMQLDSDADRFARFDWQLTPDGTSVWQGQITNMIPGCWQVKADLRGDFSCNTVRVEAGESRSITLYCGEGAIARWTPVVRLNGGQLQRCSIRMLGGASTEPETETIEYNPDTHETTELELQAGTYTVWIPTLMPQQITLAPGETRTDAFELLCANVHFTIDAPLTELLSLEGASVQLNLFPSDGWAEAEEHLIEIDAGLRNQDAEFDQLRPGVVRVWTVPLGKYSWQLVGSNQQIEGELTLTSLSESIHFGLRSMPGYEMCQVEFVGFDEDGPEFSFREDSTAEHAINAFAASTNYTPDYTTDVSSRLAGEVQVLHQPGLASLYAYAPRGAAQVTVYGGTGYLLRRAMFPGRLVISAAQIGNVWAGVLNFDGGDLDCEWEISVLHENGTCGTHVISDDVLMEVGWITVVVSRRLAGQFQTARVQVKLTAEPQTLDLTSLTYEPYAKASFVFRGRGSPESPFDAWWYGDSQPQPLLQALDQTFGGAPRYVSLGEPDRVLPDGRLEFTYDNRMLPPGRYKVIPWPGAAEKYCKTFTLAAGETQTVVIQGE